jgi:hypothetical protein
VPAEQLLEAVTRLALEVIRLRHGELPPVSLPNPPRSTALPRNVDRLTVRRRASAYLAALPPAISGCGGHNATFLAATALVHGFCLSEREAFGLLKEQYNRRCQPEWSDRELLHKVREAAQVPHRRPYGWLLQQA